MSREQYEVPNTASPALGQTNDNQAGGSASADNLGPAIQYTCGQCNLKTPLRRGDAVRCFSCGHRVLYKERTKRMVQFEAR